MITDFSYVHIPELSGNIKADVKNLLLANGHEQTLDHVASVAKTNIKIAEQYRLDTDLCELCGYLHDISAVIKPADMLSYAESNQWSIDAAERKYPFLLHQRISRIIAQQHFRVTDERILSAVECHSTLRKKPSQLDMALFIADKLSWDQEGQPPFYDVVTEALTKSLEAAATAYMAFIVENKMILYPHKWFSEGLDYLRTKI